MVLSIAFAAGFSSQVPAADLTAAQVRLLLASAGFNPGTSRQVGDLGVYTLRSVAVISTGRGRYTVRFKITEQKK